MQVLIAAQVAPDEDEVQRALRLELEAGAHDATFVIGDAEAERGRSSRRCDEGRGRERVAAVGDAETERGGAHGRHRAVVRGRCGTTGVDGRTDRGGCAEDGGEQRPGEREPRGGASHPASPERATGDGFRGPGGDHRSLGHALLHAGYSTPIGYSTLWKWYARQAWHRHGRHARLSCATCPADTRGEGGGDQDPVASAMPARAVLREPQTAADAMSYPPESSSERSVPRSRRAAGASPVGVEGLAGTVRDGYRTWRRRRAWVRLRQWEDQDRRRGNLPPMQEYRWNLRGEWLRRRVQRFGGPMPRG